MVTLDKEFVKEGVYHWPCHVDSIGSGIKGGLLDWFLLSVSAASCGTLDRLSAIVLLVFVFVCGDLSFATCVESWMWVGCA